MFEVRIHSRGGQGVVTATWSPTHRPRKGSARSRSRSATASRPRHIDAWLRDAAFIHPPEPQLASFEKLNVWYYADAPKTEAPCLDAIRRQSTFVEVAQGLDESNALFEARRCLSCGNCFGCDNCYGVCPDNAVLKIDDASTDGYAFDLDYCKGCGICVEECPCGAIEMVPEAI